jgi:3-oxoadipate enol-lactonase
METVSHDGRDTAYRRTGEGSATVLYVHGSGATHRVWAAQYGPDGPASSAAALDLSGHATSDDISTEPGRETLGAYARDVRAVARATDADVLVGSSLGGAVCLFLTLEAGFDPTGLVLAGSGAKLAVLEDLREWLHTDFERVLEFLHGQDRLYHDPDDRLVERSKAQLRATGQAVTRRDFLTAHRFDVTDSLDEIPVPALAVVGEADRLTPPASHEYLAEHIPDCTYAEVGDAAHLAMAERPESFNRHVERFLECRT